MISHLFSECHESWSSWIDRPLYPRSPHRLTPLVVTPPYLIPILTLPMFFKPRSPSSILVASSLLALPLLLSPSPLCLSLSSLPFRPFPLSFLSFPGLIANYMSFPCHESWSWIVFPLFRSFSFLSPFPDPAPPRNNQRAIQVITVLLTLPKFCRNTPNRCLGLSPSKSASGWPCRCLRRRGPDAPVSLCASLSLSLLLQLLCLPAYCFCVDVVLGWLAFPGSLPLSVCLSVSRP